MKGIFLFRSRPAIWDLGRANLIVLPPSGNIGNLFASARGVATGQTSELTLAPSNASRPIASPTTTTTQQKYRNQKFQNLKCHHHPDICCQSNRRCLELLGNAIHVQAEGGTDRFLDQILSY
jgi:hypothetical protein